MSKDLCACNCGTRIKPRNNKGKRGGRKFASGHDMVNRGGSAKAKKVWHDIVSTRVTTRGPIRKPRGERT